MEDNTINIIRESTRNLIKLNRQIHKNEESDLRRCLQEKRISSENISDIANRLKTKTAISEIDLQNLKNGLMEDSQYIGIVLNVHGALRGLVKELTGHNIKNQVAAAGCCCNLALGDVKACTALAKAAGSYLVAALDNFTTELAVTCAWTIGNLAGSGDKVCDILVSQGAVSKLSDFHNNEDFQDAALYALVHFAYQMKDNLRQDHLNKMIQTLTKLDISTASLQLLFILSCHNNFKENINEDILKKILDHLPTAIKSTDIQQSNNILLFITRILANMDGFYNIILKCIDMNNLYEEIKVLVNCNNSVSESLLWLLGNLLNFCDDKEILFKLYS